MFLNLLYRSMKADVCEPRVQAYIKRLIQSCSLQLPPYSVACLTLVFELCKARPSIIYGFLGSKSLDGSKNMDEDDGEEHFTDVKDEFDVESGYTKEPSNTNATSWTHKHKDSMRHTSNVYNPLHRNPLYAAADQTNLWEVHSMTRHFHPTVAIYAKELYESKTDSDTRTGDPLDDYTLIKFLDRFVYRNPKSKEVTSRKKANQSVRLLSANHRRRHAAFNQTQIPVNSPEFLQKTNLAPDEVFYHRYFSQLSHMKTPKADKTEEDSDIESVSDGEFDEFMSGQAKNNKLDFSESIYNKSSAPNEKFNEEDSDRESGSEDQASETEDYGFNMEEGEDDLLEEEDLDEAGIFDTGPKETGKRKVNKGSSRQSKPPTKRRRHENDLDKFNIMMEENANDKYVKLYVG
uniref:CCAAT-binding factor domain-containing protein n=1 Tax=Ciona savignyi TaxID=51511 RepID=H2YRJ6_CIOSA